MFIQTQILFQLFLKIHSPVTYSFIHSILIRINYIDFAMEMHELELQNNNLTLFDMHISRP